MEAPEQTQVLLAEQLTTESLAPTETVAKTEEQPEEEKKSDDDAGNAVAGIESTPELVSEDSSQQASQQCEAL